VQEPHSSPTLEIARQELVSGWTGSKGASVALQLIPQKDLGADGFRLERGCIQASSEQGLLYGVFDLLRRQRTGQPVHGIVSRPAYTLRILNHWDNPDGSVERGYAGRSLFWRGMADLAVTPADRTLWREYARANASVGINATVLNNVNASPEVLSPGMLQRAAAVAEELRPYGIRVFLSINFSSPVRLGKLGTSDPLDERVRTWWAERVREIYRLIPDFGGFLVKATVRDCQGHRILAAPMPTEPICWPMPSNPSVAW
jgi:alpha-glucuronidase